MPDIQTKHEAPFCEEIETNKRVTQRANYMVMSDSNEVVIAILAKDKGYCLPFFLDCIYNQTFPKKQTHIYIRTNDNKDNTESILRSFVNKHGGEYASTFMDASGVSKSLKTYGEHEWNPERFKILGKIRMDSVLHAQRLNAHYFVVDVDNFIVPSTLQDMFDARMAGVVSPMLELYFPDGRMGMYSNFHYDVDANGYLKTHPMYDELLSRKVTGLVSVGVVHCTYFIQNTLLGAVCYDDNTKRYEYVIFSHTLRKNKIPQYLDNRKWYGFLHLTDGSEFPATLAACSPLLNRFKTRI